jgi:predicted DNA repair protein MutK
VEKIVHKFFHAEEEAAGREALAEAIVDENVDLVAFEKEKIRGAVRTDFVLSAEIMAIALGAVAEANFLTRVIVLTLISLGMTVGVYGLVALIVKLDDFGLVLSRQSSAIAKHAGKGLLKVVPLLMKGLGIFGTLAMFLVGGGIFVHGLPALHHAVLAVAERTSVLAPVTEQLGVILVGVVVGTIAVGIVTLAKRARAAVG